MMRRLIFFFFFKSPYFSGIMALWHFDQIRMKSFQQDTCISKSIRARGSKTWLANREG